jgi:peptidylamidoglycolate lyase
MYSISSLNTQTTNMKLLRFLLIILIFTLTYCGSRKKSDNASAVRYELVKDWMHPPSGFRFSDISSLAIDTFQNLIFLQRTNRHWTNVLPDSLISSNTIFVIDLYTGEFLSSWGGNLFIMPHSLTVDNNNNVWVTDVGLHQIFKFDHEGKLLMKLGVAKIAGNDDNHFNLPTDVAVCSDGSFYVSDGYGNSRILKFDKAGKYLFEWGKKGTGPGEFDVPHSISVDTNGNVYVADRENNRIQKFSANGTFLREWKNDEANKLYALTTNLRNEILAVDDLYVNDSLPMGDGIMKFNSDLELKMRFGRNDSTVDKKALYHDIVIDKEDNIFAADILGQRIDMFRKVSR